MAAAPRQTYHQQCRPDHAEPCAASARGNERGMEVGLGIFIRLERGLLHRHAKVFVFDPIGGSRRYVFSSRFSRFSWDKSTTICSRESFSSKRVSYDTCVSMTGTLHLFRHPMVAVFFNFIGELSCFIPHYVMRWCRANAAKTEDSSSHAVGYPWYIALPAFLRFLSTLLVRRRRARLIQFVLLFLCFLFFLL